MNCSYRILKDVHIGVRVRKTKDKTTVPYKNEPIENVYIERWNDQGFRLKHEAFPTKDNTIWLDFGQLPLNQLNIEMGFIKNPIVFVEAIMGYGGTTSMVFLRADTFDYLELLEDHSYKVESEKLKPTQLKPGDQVISCICRESNVMIYLGRFRLATKTQKYQYGRAYSYSGRYVDMVEEAPEHALFAYPQPNGKYNVVSYPLTNKHIVELYRASDKGKAFEENRFNDLEENKRLLQEIFSSKENQSYKETFQTETNPIQKAGTHGHAYSYSHVYVADGSLKKSEVVEKAKKFFNI
jgi:hypothetical protein